MGVEVVKRRVGKRQSRTGGDLARGGRRKKKRGGAATRGKNTNRTVWL